MRENLCMLAVLAHPDDEVFPAAGTIAQAVQRGVRVVLAVATGGEEGEVVNPDLRDSIDLVDLPRLRQEELACSQHTLGIAEIVRLGYRDSGMADSAGNQKSESFINVDLETVTERVVGLMRRYRPQVVCTFDEQGGYGHPDHIHIYRATTAAFDRAGDAAWYPHAGAVWQPLKLYYFAFAQDMIRRARAGYAAHGLPFVFGSGLNTATEENTADLGYRDEQISAIVDIRSTVEQKIAAFRCYRTQVRPDFFYFTAPPDVVHDALSREYFIRGRCLVDSPLPETDVFAGL